MLAFLLFLISSQPIYYVKPYEPIVVVPLVPLQAPQQILMPEPDDIDDILIKDQKEILACSCIKYARSLGVPIPHGTDARDIESRDTPTIGGLALFKFKNNTYHVGVIVEMRSDAFRIKQANKKPCEIDEEWIFWTNPWLTGFRSY